MKGATLALSSVNPYIDLSKEAVRVSGIETHRYKSSARMFLYLAMKGRLDLCLEDSMLRSHVTEPSSVQLLGVKRKFVA